MASASCAPCVFGAVQSTTITVPYSVVGATTISLIPHVFTVNGSVTTSTQTATIAEGSVPTSSLLGGISTITVNHSSEIVASTLGTVLTYGTTYVHYLAFEGAAATASSVCAQTLAPSTLSLPADAEASLIYPESEVGSTLPAALLGYLDGAGGFPAQLNGDQVTECVALGSVLPVPTNLQSPSSTSSTATFQSSGAAPSNSSSISSSATTPSSSVSSLLSSSVPPIISTNTTSVSAPAPASASPTSSSTTSLNTTIISISAITTQTSTLTTSTTIATTTSISSLTTETTNIPPPTTFTSYSPVVVSTSEVVQTTQTVAHTPVQIFSIVTGAPISGSSSVMVSSPIPTPLGVSLGSSSSSAATDIGGLLSALASLTVAATSSTTLSGAFTTSSAVLANGTTSYSSYAVGPVTASPPYPYSGTNATTLTSTASNGSIYTVPYTGAANKVMQPLGMGWYEALFGLAMLVW